MLNNQEIKDVKNAMIENAVIRIEILNRKIAELEAKKKLISDVLYSALPNVGSI
jgi:hypothetical protein